MAIGKEVVLQNSKINDASSSCWDSFFMYAILLLATAIMFIIWWQTKSILAIMNIVYTLYDSVCEYPLATATGVKSLVMN